MTIDVEQPKAIDVHAHAERNQKKAIDVHAHAERNQNQRQDPVVLKENAARMLGLLQ